MSGVPRISSMYTVAGMYNQRLRGSRRIVAKTMPSTSPTAIAATVISTVSRSPCSKLRSQLMISLTPIPFKAPIHTDRFCCGVWSVGVEKAGSGNEPVLLHDLGCRAIRLHLVPHRIEDADELRIVFTDRQAVARARFGLCVGKTPPDFVFALRVLL